MDSPSKARDSKPHLTRNANFENLLEAEVNSHIDNRSGNRPSRFDTGLERNHHNKDIQPERSKPRPSVPARHSLHKEREWTDVDDPLLSARNHVNEDDEQRRDRQTALERSALMMDLRKRRLPDHNEDRVQRSSSGSLSFRPMTVEQRKDISRSENLNGLSQPQITKPPEPGTMESSLIQRHSRGSLRNRRSREISLPRWQPDAEVSYCPICGNAFSFWYRKHHCRKCGRVVCANCSPHRITIPRQFIVQPPQDTSSSQSPSQRGIPVIDLTRDDQVDNSATDSLGHQHTASPKNQRLQIDPALGGGQEVRLCNPCVPDPNPLPHVAFGSSPPFSLDSNPAPENVGRASDLSAQQQPGVSSRQPFSIQQDYDSRNKNFEFLSNQLLRSGTITSSHVHYGDAARASNSSRYLPRPFSSTFGSAPDTSLHDVSDPASSPPLSDVDINLNISISAFSSHFKPSIVFLKVIIAITRPPQSFPATHDITTRHAFLYPCLLALLPMHSPSSAKKTSVPSATRLFLLKGLMVLKQSVRLMSLHASKQVSPARFRTLYNWQLGHGPKQR
ncbi:MAG: hypothetical protein LQ351_001012 [Letrouitia transgressa]|nr:MAG: hypothetical protein LQ351_001012 [Letrouitia transgressa]